MARDPMTPVIPLGIEPNPDAVIINSRGEVRQDYRIILSDEDVGRMRAGYVCAKCMEPQKKPFPDQCAICKFPMSDRQAEFLAKAYQGSVRVGPTSSLEDELAALEEMQKREDRAFDPFQILLPGKDF